MKYFWRTFVVLGILVIVSIAVAMWWTFQPTTIASLISPNGKQKVVLLTDYAIATDLWLWRYEIRPTGLIQGLWDRKILGECDIPIVSVGKNASSTIMVEHQLIKWTDDDRFMIRITSLEPKRYPTQEATIDIHHPRFPCQNPSRRPKSKGS